MKDEREWQAAVRMVGAWGVLWALVMLLIRKRVISGDEMNEAVQAEVGRQMTLK